MENLGSSFLQLHASRCHHTAAFQHLQISPKSSAFFYISEGDFQAWIHLKNADPSRISVLSAAFVLIGFEKTALTAHLITEKLTLLKAGQEGGGRSREETL